MVIWDHLRRERARPCDGRALRASGSPAMGAGPGVASSYMLRRMCDQENASWTSPRSASLPSRHSRSNCKIP